MNKTQKYTFFIIVLISALSFIYCLIFKRTSIADWAVSMGFFALVYYFTQKNNLTIGAVLTATIAVLLHLFGAIGLYGHFILPGIIGYDKLVHFVSGIAVTYALSQIITEKQKSIYYLSIILITIGLGAILEINEFIGTAYFGLETGGIFAIGDGLPVKTDLQKYDTYYDMMFNLVGAIIAVILVMIQTKYYKKKF